MFCNAFLHDTTLHDLNLALTIRTHSALFTLDASAKDGRCFLPIVFIKDFRKEFWE